MKKAKLKRQEEKKINKNTGGGINKIVWFIISIVVILAILVGFYFLTEKILENRKDNEPEETKELVSVRKLNDINYSDVDKMVAKTYFLLFDKGDDKSNSQYDLYIDLLKYNNFGIEFYYIDLSKEENKGILGKKESLKTLGNIKVKDTTLIFVNNGDISNTYVGSKKILEYLSGFFGSTNSNSDGASNDNKSNSNNTSNKSNSNKSNSNSNSNSNKSNANSNK